MKSHTAELNKITEVNNKWGICGFVSVLAAMYDNDLGFKGIMNEIEKKNHYKTRIIAEMSSYLSMLEADNNKLLTEVRVFTSTFGDIYNIADNKTFIELTQQYARLVDKVLEARKRGEEISLDELHEFGIAMTPDSVQDYLYRMHNIKSNHVEDSKNIICGCYAKNDPNKKLKHWIYVNGQGKVFTWGKEYISLNEFEKNKGYSKLYGIKPIFK